MKKNYILNRIFALTVACFVTCAGFMSCSMKIEPVPTETIQGTAEEIIDIIDDRIVGNFDIVVTDEMDNSSLSQFLLNLKSAETSTSRTIDIHSIDISRATGVTAIPHDAFSTLEKLESVKLPNTIESISYNAFKDTAIKNIAIPDSVTYIDRDAFDGCASLEAINVDADNIEFKSINGVLYSYDESELYVYPNAKSGSSFTVPDDTEYIWSDFGKLKELNTLNVPASVRTMNSSSFSTNNNLYINVADANTHYSSENGALYEKSPKKLLAWPSARGDIVLNGLSEIPNGCFRNNNKITSVRIISPEGGTEIEDYAFSGCERLSSVYLGGTTEIGSNAFYNCTRLSYVDLGDVEEIGTYAFYNCDNLYSISLGNVEIIGYRAFYDCNNLYSVNLGSVKEIGSYAFYNCDLRSVIIPTSTEKIGSYAFYSYSSYYSDYYSNKNLSNVTFTDEAGWYITTNSNYTGGTAINEEDIHDSAQNAANFKSSGNWYNKYLYKSSGD